MPTAPRGEELKMMPTVIKRSIVFVFIALLLLLRAHSLLALMGLRATHWLLPVSIAIVFGLAFAFFPVTFSRGAAAPVLAALTVVTFLEAGLFAAIFLIVLVSEAVFPILLFGALGYALIAGAYALASELGASVATVLFIAVLISAAQPAYRSAKKLMSRTVTTFSELFEAALDWRFPFPIRVMQTIWKSAETVGAWLGGDIIEFYKVRTPDFASAARVWKDEGFLMMAVFYSLIAIGIAMVIMLLVIWGFFE